jgi:hypothetical protein
MAEEVGVDLVSADAIASVNEMVDKQLNYKIDEYSAADPTNYIDVNVTGSIPTLAATAASACVFDIPPGLFSWADSALHIIMSSAGAPTTANINFLDRSCIQGIRIYDANSSTLLLDVQQDFQALFEAVCVPAIKESELRSSSTATISGNSGAASIAVCNEINTNSELPLFDVGDGKFSGNLFDGSYSLPYTNAATTLVVGATNALRQNATAFGKDSRANFLIAANESTTTYYLTLRFKNFKNTILGHHKLFPAFNARLQVQLYFAATNEWHGSVVSTAASPPLIVPGATIASRAPSISSLFLRMRYENVQSEIGRKMREQFMSGGIKMVIPYPVVNKIPWAATGTSLTHQCDILKSNGENLVALMHFVETSQTTLPQLAHRRINTSTGSLASTDLGLQVNQRRTNLDSVPRQKDLLDLYQTYAYLTNHFRGSMIQSFRDWINNSNVFIDAFVPCYHDFDSYSQLSPMRLPGMRLLYSVENSGVLAGSPARNSYIFGVHQRVVMLSPGGIAQLS